MEKEKLLEYVIIYGWVLVIFFIIVSVLLYYGFFTPTEQLGEGPTFKTIGYKLNNTYFAIVVENKLLSTVTLKEIALFGDVVGENTLEIELAPNKSATISLEKISGKISNAKIGDIMNVDVFLKYKIDSAEANETLKLVVKTTP